MVPPLVELALDYYRDPLSYPRLRDGGQVLQPVSSGMLVELCRALSPPRIDATAAFLDSDAGEVREAGRFLLRQMLLQVEGDHYRCLDLDPDAPLERIRTHYLLLIGLFHPDRGGGGNDLDVIAATRLNTAYRTLHDPLARADYDRSLPPGGVHLAGNARAFLKRPALGLVGMDLMRRRRPVRCLRGGWPGPILMFTGLGIVGAISLLLLPQKTHLRMTQSGVSPGVLLPSYVHDVTRLPLPVRAVPRPGSAPMPIVVPVRVVADPMSLPAQP
ncbi:J domain-containing protein [uncultured Thiodictyon sp.]|uniref:J domain-containing protein n=1 Tax=uncultured Thiodictyon sp. TaxID=1846217 RepID=UPI0025F4673F|nr:J domain-containing protein [uncultured Thiodictyon sp.]